MCKTFLEFFFIVLSLYILLFVLQFLSVLKLISCQCISQNPKLGSEWEVACINNS